ncbi:MAG TPA: hypothetical protein VG755_42075 [Nannocystaceae bacterium]|nr:hypothetical protein [Nannocystaceae bacterium]
MPGLTCSHRAPRGAYLLAPFAALFLTRIAHAEHVVADGYTGSIHVLDDDMNQVSTFALSYPFPDGVASDGTMIYVGYNVDVDEIQLYDFAGGSLGSIDVGSGLVGGLELVDDELFVARQTQMDVHDAVTGAFIRTISFPPGAEFVEGLGFDGELLWVLGLGTMHGIDPEDGAVQVTLESEGLCPNSTGGVAASGPDELTIVCGTGEWWVISSIDGSVIDEGNSGIGMFGSAYVAFAECGDAIVEGDEECDEGISSTCDDDCTLVECGDGTMNPLAAEECDDGNVSDGDGCSASCSAELPGTSDDGGDAESSTTEGGSTEASTTLDTSEGTSTAADSTQGTSGVIDDAGTSHDGDGESTTNAPAVDDADAGCGCRNTTRRGWAWWALAIVGLRRRARMA